MGGVQAGAMRSDELYAAASRWLVGGMSAAARLNPALGRPFYATRGEGARLWDVDGREYVDLNTSFGAALLGYRHPAIDAAVGAATELGTEMTARHGVVLVFDGIPVRVPHRARIHPGLVGRQPGHGHAGEVPRERDRPERVRRAARGHGGRRGCAARVGRPERGPARRDDRARLMVRT